MIKYAVFTVQTPAYDLETTLAQLRRHGYDGVEWRIAGLPPANPDPLLDRSMWYWSNNRSTIEPESILDQAAEIRDLCRRSEIEPFALSSYLTPDQKGAIEVLLQAARIIGSRMIRVNPYKYTGAANYNELFTQTRRELAGLAEMAAHYQTGIVLEIHMGNMIPSASAARRLLDGLDPRHIGVIYDAGNMVHEGYEQYQMGMELLGPYLHHIHIKDACWTINPAAADSRYKVDWCPIGQGVVDFPALFRAMKKVGYSGYLSFEDFSNEQSDEAKLAGNLTYIRSLVESI